MTAPPDNWLGMLMHFQPELSRALLPVAITFDNMNFFSKQRLPLLMT